MQLELNTIPISEKFLMMEQLWKSMSQDATNNGFSPSWHFDILEVIEQNIKDNKVVFSDLSDARARLQKLVG